MNEVNVIQILFLMLLSIGNANQEHIKKVNTKLSEEQVNQISHSIEKYSKEFDIDAKLILAIIQVESTFNINVISKTQDYGLMQVNINTIKDYEFNSHRIRYDIDYSIFCGMIYLTLMKRRYPEDKYWWARYHSSTPKYKQTYIKKILKVIRGSI